MHTPITFFRLIIPVLLLVSSLTAAARKTGIHSHNDYEQPRPFWAAYEAGAASIEADIWLIDGRIYVAHDRKDVKPDRQLKNMYLLPIKEVMDRNGGKAHPKGKRLQLLVDLKSGAETLDALVSLIESEGMVSYFNVKDNPSAVQIVITGSKIARERFADYPHFIYFDGTPGTAYTSGQQERLAMLSAHYGKFTKWRGKGEMAKEEQQRIRKAVKEAHQMGCTFRLWAFPDNEAGWKMTRKLGMDFINTDHPAQVAEWM